jgi:hypothetical protein
MVDTADVKMDKDGNDFYLEAEFNMCDFKN